MPTTTPDTPRLPALARPRAVVGPIAIAGLLALGCSSSSPATPRDAGHSDAHLDASPSDATHADAPSRDSSPGDSARHDAASQDAASHDATPVDASNADAARDAASGDATAHANGTLGTWQTLTPMPVPRANHCSVTVGGYLVVLGGNYMPDGGSSFVALDAVLVAPLHADGTLGAWSQAGSTPSPVSGCTAVASDNTIYLIDGIYDDASDEGQVYSAELSASGTLGSWTTRGPLPNGQDAFYSDAWVASDATSTLYAMDSSMTLTAALRVPTSPSLGSWVEDDWLPGFLGRPEYAFTGDYVYAIGGYTMDDAGDNPAVTTVHAAPVEADGSIGAPFTTEPLPAPVTFGKAVAVDGWVFVVGGKASVYGPGEASTRSSLVGAGGKLGTWTAQASLPQGRTDMALTLAGDFLYLTGGGYDGPGLATVCAARVRF